MEIDYKKVRVILNDYGEDCVKEMIRLLDAKGVTRIREKLNKNVIEDLEYIKLAISMPGYAIYTDEGRGPGKMPPIDKIKDWCNFHQIPEKRAWPIAKHIAEFGTEHSARHFLKVFHEKYPDYRKKLLLAFKNDVKDELSMTVTREI